MNSSAAVCCQLLRVDCLFALHRTYAREERTWKQAGTVTVAGSAKLI